MRAIKSTRIVVMVVVLAAAAQVIFLAPATGQAACAQTTDLICGSSPGTSDCDGDGFTDYEECFGITFTGSGAFFPGFNSGSFRTNRLDPAGMDLFFFFVPASPSLLPASQPAQIYSNALPVTVHQISASDADPNRFVTSAQKAVRITESLDTTGTILGAAWQGTPNGLDGVTVYTQRIADFVSSRCGSNSCTDISGVSGILEVTDLYMMNVIAHELGHVSSLTPTKDRRFEWHYAPESGVVMEVSAKYTSNRKTGAVIFYLSDAYTPEDVAGVAVK